VGTTAAEGIQEGERTWNIVVQNFVTHLLLSHQWLVIVARNRYQLSSSSRTYSASLPVIPN
jgi:hypothetical protein